MKIAYRMVANSYDKLTEMLNNQLDIFEELQMAVNNLVELEDFKGGSAANIKAYYSELHGELIRAFKALIYDIDITMYYSNKDFEENIDAAYTPVYESQYIQDKIDAEGKLLEAFETVTAELAAERQAVSDIVDIYENFSYDDVCEEFADTIDYAKSAKEDFENFNGKHEKDFADAQTAIENIMSAINGMKTLGNVDGIKDYIPGGWNTNDWLQGLLDYQLSVGDKIENNNWEATFEYLDAYASVRTIEALIESGYDIGISIKELRDLYKAGLKFNLDISEETGEVIFKIVSEFDDLGDLQEALRKIGCGSIKHAKLEEMLTDGIKIVDDAGNVVNKKALEKLLKSDDLAKILKNIENIEKYMGEGQPVLKIGKDILDVVDVTITVGTDVYDNIYNPTTGQYMQDLDGGTVIDLATDLGVDLGCDLGLPAAGAAIGSAICPGIGTAIGAGVGAIADIVFTWDYGEPPKSLADHVKDGIRDGVDTVTNWFSTVFW